MTRFEGHWTGVQTLPGRIAQEVQPFARPIGVVAVLALAWAVWASGPSWATPAVVVLAIAGAMLGVIDTATHRLPNAIVFPTTAVVGGLLIFAAVMGAATGEPAWGDLVRAALGFAAHAGFYWLTWLIFKKKRGVGKGDLKLSGILGAVAAWWGWETFLIAMMTPYMLGGVFALILLMFRLASLKSHIPFGPFMLLGVVVALTWARLTGGI